MAQDQETTPSKKITDVCKLCGDAFGTAKNKFNLFIKNIKQDFAFVLEELTAIEVSSDGASKEAVCGLCRSRLRKYRRCKAQTTKIADEIRELALRKRGSKTTPPRPRRVRERKKLFIERTKQGYKKQVSQDIFSHKI